MNYLLLIYGDERDDTEEMHDLSPWNAYTAAVQAAGVYLGGNGLMPTTMATTVRVRDGRTVTTDGPFAETKEQLGGYYLLDCKDLDEAIGWAARIPSAGAGSVEVRPVMQT
ncbi:MAG: YciI family protein [Longimicrobiales bacterium]